MEASDSGPAGRRILARAAALARFSDSPQPYTRTFLTAAHRAAAQELAGWMHEAGLAVRVDGVGNVIGRLGGPGAALLLGSHFDSVRNGGRYDGVLGILVALEAVESLARGGASPAHPVEVIAFSDEEGARFQTSFLASRAFVRGAAALEPLRDKRDAEGTTLAEAIRGAALDPASLVPLDPATAAAYVEVHIEQGPVLLDADQPLGVVTSIASGGRFRVRVEGVAGHAGTVPMAGRRDALAAAAEMLLALERRCSSVAGVVGTAGILQVPDGTANVIPGLAEFTADIRAPGDAERRAAEDGVRGAFEAIAARRGVTVAMTRTHEVHAVPCAGWLQEALAQSVERVTAGAAPRLPSGAGHDAMVLAEACDVGMLFVRCGAGGVSHNPAETITEGDAGLAFAALRDFLAGFRPPPARAAPPRRP